MRIIERLGANDRSDARSERIIEIDDDERFVSKDVSVTTRDGNAAGAGEDAIGIEGQGALEEIVGRIAVKGRANARAL